MNTENDILTLLMQRWSGLVSGASQTSNLPEEADTIAFSALHLASRKLCGAGIGFCQDDLLKCLELANERKRFSTMEAMPWRLVGAILLGDNPSPSRNIAQWDVVAEDFQEKITHHKSDFRLWFYKLAWLVPKEEPANLDLLPGLLQNIADTLGYATEAIHLANSYFPSVDCFLEYARENPPSGRFIEQYFDRLNQIEEKGIEAFPNTLATCEEKCLEYLKGIKSQF